LEFPTAQGAETWTANSGNNELVVGAGSISIGYDVLTVPKGVAFSGQGFAYNNGSVVSNTTWAGLQTKIEAIQALAPASDATTLNVNDAITIQNGESPVGTNTIILSASAGDNQLLLNDDAGTAGYVLTSGGPDGSMTWSAGGGGGGTTLEEAITNGGGVANSSFQIQEALTPNYSQMANNGFIVQNVDGGAIFPPVNTTTTSNLSPASLVLTNENQGNTLTATIGVNSVSYRTSSGIYEAEYEEDHMRVWNDGKGVPIYSTIYPNEITLYDATYTGTEGLMTIKRNKFQIGNDEGVAGQAIGKDGNGDLAWITGSGATPNLDAVLTEGNESTQSIVLRVNPTDETGNKATFSASSGSYLTYDNFVVVNQTLADSGKIQITTGNPDTNGSENVLQSNSVYIRNATQSTNITANTTSILNGDANANHNLISLDSVNSILTMESVQTGVNKVNTLGLNGLSISDSVADETSTLSTNNLSLISGDINTTFTEVSLSSTDTTMLVKTQGVGVLRQTQITNNAVQVFESLGVGQENYVSLEPKRLGIDVDGTLDYGTAGQVLTSGGSDGVLSWANGAGATPNLNAVLTEGNSSDQSILLQQSVIDSGYKLSLDTTGVINSYYNTTTNVLENQNSLNRDGMFLTQDDVETIGSSLEARTTSISVRNNNTTTGIDKSIAIDTGTASSTPYVNLYNTQTGITKQTAISTDNLNITDGTLTSNLTTTGLQFTDADYSTTLGQNGLISTRPALEIQNDTLISIGTNQGVSNYIEIGNLDSTISLVGEVNAPTPATNISSTVIPTTAWVNTFFATISSLSNYLTTASASATYQTLAGMASYLTTASASATYQTLAGMGSYLTTATASSTYQTLAGMSAYLTTATASSTYQTISGLGSALATITPITIGTSAGSANAITIGNNSGSTSTYSLVGVKGKFSINDVLFSGGDGGTTQLGVASYTIPADAVRNSLYTLIIAGTANPTPVAFPTDDTGGKYITIYNAGSQGIRCECSASPTRLFVGGNNGLAGGTTYAIRANQVVQFLSAGSSGFLVFAQTNPNSNQGLYPYPVQSLTTNQRVIATRITGASVNGTFTYTSISGQQNFASPASVQLTAEDATGNHTMTLRTNTVAGFTYVSSTGSFPTTLHIYALGV
jgi:hypothetical protein